MKDLTADNITENVHQINSLCQDERMKYVLERLVTHLHDFARETRLSMHEWMTGLLFLTEVGKICSDVRQVRLFPFWSFLSLFGAKRREVMLTGRTGIHPPKRRPRPLPPSRQHRPPQTHRLNRRHSPRPLPHARRPRDQHGLLHVLRPKGRAVTRSLHAARHAREPHPRREDRYLGDGFHGALRCAVSREG